MSFLGFVITILLIYYIFTGYRFLRIMNDINCKCALEHEEYKNLQKWIKIVIGTYIVAFVAAIWAKLEKNISIYSVVLVLFVLMIIIDVCIVFYARKMDLFVHFLADTNCECSKNLYREFNQTFSLFFIIFKSLRLLVLFFIIANFNKVQPLLKKSFQKK